MIEVNKKPFSNNSVYLSPEGYMAFACKNHFLNDSSVQVGFTVCSLKSASFNKIAHRENHLEIYRESFKIESLLSFRDWRYTKSKG